MSATDTGLDSSRRDDLLAGLAEIRLLTVDGADFRRVGVEAVDGMVTLIGEVKTDSERIQAAAVVGKVEGVSAVDNQLQVIRESQDGSPYNQGLDTKIPVQILEKASSGRVSKTRGDR